MRRISADRRARNRRDGRPIWPERLLLERPVLGVEQGRRLITPELDPRTLKPVAPRRCTDLREEWDRRRLVSPDPSRALVGLLADFLIERRVGFGVGRVKGGIAPMRERAGTRI